MHKVSLIKWSLVLENYLEFNFRDVIIKLGHLCSINTHYGNLKFHLIMCWHSLNVRYIKWIEWQHITLSLSNNNMCWSKFQELIGFDFHIYERAIGDQKFTRITYILLSSIKWLEAHQIHYLSLQRYWRSPPSRITSKGFTLVYQFFWLGLLYVST